jgi:hypothetical protein
MSEIIAAKKKPRSSNPINTIPLDGDGEIARSGSSPGLQNSFCKISRSFDLAERQDDDASA